MPDSILAIGGGSVLDMAKLIKAFYGNHGLENKLQQVLKQIF